MKCSVGRARPESHYRVCRSCAIRSRGADVPDPDGIIVGFAAPADHAFTAAVGALLDVLNAAGLAR